MTQPKWDQVQAFALERLRKHMSAIRGTSDGEKVAVLNARIDELREVLSLQSDLVGGMRAKPDVVVSFTFEKPHDRKDG